MFVHLSRWSNRGLGDANKVIYLFQQSHIKNDIIDLTKDFYLKKKRSSELKEQYALLFVQWY